MIYKLLTAILAFLLAAFVAFFLLLGPDLSATTTTWDFALTVASPDGRYVAGRLIESNRRDVRSGLAVGERVNGRDVHWCLAFPFDSVVWNSLVWTDNRHLVVHATHVAGDDVPLTTRLNDMDVEVTLQQ